MRLIDRDVDPVTVDAFMERRRLYAEKTATWGVPERCKTQICDGDGSCVACGADQGENCCPRKTP